MNATVKIIIFSIVYLNIYLYFFGQKFKEYLDDNWTAVRCYPHILPFAGLSSKAEGFTFFDKTLINFNVCFYNILKGMIDYFSKPLMQVINGMVNALKSMSSIIDSFRSMSRVIRELYSALVESVYNRMSNSFAAFVYLQEKLKNLIKRQSAIFEVLMQFFTAMPFLFYSFSHGPIPRFAYWLSHYWGALVAFIAICILCAVGGPFISIFACPVCALCFDANTPVIIDNKKVILRNVQIGDKIGESIITGKLSLKTYSYELYNYNGIFVSGTHLVKHNNKWIRVKDVPNISKISKFTDLVCFTTNNNIIELNNITFRDYTESKNTNISFNIHNYMKQSNNDSNFEFTPIFADTYLNNYLWGFGPNTDIEINGTIYTIKDIVENNLFNNNIIGGFKQVDDSIDWYKYNNSIYVTGNTLVYEDGMWIRVYESDYSKLTKEKFQLYNLVTSDNKIKINGILFRDFVETSDMNVIDKIDKYVLERVE